MFFSKKKRLEKEEQVCAEIAKYRHETLTAIEQTSEKAKEVTEKTAKLNTAIDNLGLAERLHQGMGRRNGN